MKLNKLKQRWELWKLRWQLRLQYKNLCSVHFEEKCDFGWPEAPPEGMVEWWTQKTVKNSCRTCYRGKQMESQLEADAKKYQKQRLLERGKQLRQNLGL
jgi:hypothetical protein